MRCSAALTDVFNTARPYAYLSIWTPIPWSNDASCTYFGTSSRHFLCV